jgi:class 3 adenylate cyclase
MIVRTGGNPAHEASGGGTGWLSRQLDPEDYRAVVQAYQAAAVEAIQPFDSYIAQYLGDRLLVYFGWPQAHEDAARRAVHASLALVDGMALLNSRLVPQYGIRVAVRVGLHTGLAVVGAMGSGTRQELLAMGDTPPGAAHPGWIDVLPRLCLWLL